ncbi:MAG: Flp family type IVb pilin [Planctomycetes bacterium]|nr:Flp family type IVb pilin [Planctomycetota bacterium]
MRRVSEKAARFLRDEDGPTAVQYAMLTMLILMALLAAASSLGRVTADSLESSCEKLESTFENCPL